MTYWSAQLHRRERPSEKAYKEYTRNKNSGDETVGDMSAMH